MSKWNNANNANETINTGKQAEQSKIVITWEETEESIQGLESEMTNINVHSALHMLAEVMEKLCEKTDQSLGEFMMHHKLKKLAGEFFAQSEEEEDED